MCQGYQSPIYPNLKFVSITQLLESAVKLIITKNSSFQTGHFEKDDTFLYHQKIGQDKKVVNLQTGVTVNIHWTGEQEKSLNFLGWIDSAPLLLLTDRRSDFDRIGVVVRDSVIALFSGNGVLIFGEQQSGLSFLV